MPPAPSEPQAEDREPQAAAPRVVVTVPTFNEAANVPALLDLLLALPSDVHVLVIDDDSPDGTWRRVEERAQREPRVHLLRRLTDKGRGRAGRDGFVRALALGARLVVEMDADLSHHPRHVPALLARLESTSEPVGLVLGSRAVSGGRDADRGLGRRWLTKAANLYIRVVLGIDVRDANSGFRAWKRSTLEAIRVGATFSSGPAIVQELLYKTARARIGIAEVPIQFENRLHGSSTLTFGKLLQGYVTVLRLRWQSWLGRL